MEEFEKMIGEGGFVEHAKFGGNRYGTSKRMIGEISAGGRVVVLDIEMEVRKSQTLLILSLHFSFKLLLFPVLLDTAKPPLARTQLILFSF